MSWDKDLLADQRDAARHTGAHSRLLAGPGTGKTLVITRRMLYLINVLSVQPDEILALTFTRAAAQELRQRALEELGEASPQPRIHTLHSFALRQLLMNSEKLDTLPRPLRIADDWEERNIIQEDLKRVLDVRRITEVQEHFHQLSSDWQSLSAELGEFTPVANFVGAWQDHRRVFGYTLRSELVFQLKRALDQIQDFELEAPIRQLLVDEYQDLNKCDLAIVDALVEFGPELFVAGDDDQSIYGFRKAHPQGIRGFLDDYPGSEALAIETCMRCDTDILALAEFVADLDTDRIPKNTRARNGAAAGEVALLGFADQVEEASSLAALCRCLISRDGYAPSDILILSRVDTNNAFSRVLEAAFEEEGIPFSADISSDSPLDVSAGRMTLAILRLLRNQSDHLAWRTILQLRRNLIGKGINDNLIGVCRKEGLQYSDLLFMIENDPSILDRFGNRISEEVRQIRGLVRDLLAHTDPPTMTKENLMALVGEIASWATEDMSLVSQIAAHISLRIGDTEIEDLNHALGILEATNVDIEQEIDPQSVNMLTMHKAKGLTSNAVIVLAAEDEIIPGRQEAEPFLGDERRLLFVSLSRARHMLFVTFCTERSGQQAFMGRPTDSSRRHLSRFLQYAPIRAEPGADYVRGRCAG